jgi:chaperonin GroES
MNLKPIANRIIVSPTDQGSEETRESGLITLKKEVPPSTRGVIVAVGPRIEQPIKVGDNVVYGQHSGAEVEWEGKNYLIMRDTEIICVL